MVAIRPAAASPRGRGGAGCPNLLQRPRSSRSAGGESLIFRAFLRGRSRPGAPLQQIRTRLRPGPPQEPHPPHHAGAPRRRARMRCGGRSSGRRSGPVPAPPPRRLSRIMRWCLACRDAADPEFVCYAPSPSATPLFPVQRRVKGRSRGWVGAARAKKWGASLSVAAIPAGLSPGGTSGRPARGGKWRSGRSVPPRTRQRSHRNRGIVRKSPSASGVLVRTILPERQNRAREPDETGWGRWPKPPETGRVRRPKPPETGWGRRPGHRARSPGGAVD